MNNWLSLGSAAEFLDCSPDTVLRRGVPWRDTPVVGRVRYKLLQLDPDKKKRRERRYFRDDLEALLVAA